MFKRLLGDSVSLVFGNLDTVFKVCGTWFVLQFVLSMMILMATGGRGTDPDLASGSAAMVLLLAVNVVVAILSSASISVAWHRFGLLGESPSVIHLRLGPVEFQFILKLLLLGLISFAAFLPVGIVFAVFGKILPPVIAGVCFALVCLWIIPLLLRLNLILPATAIEKPLGLADAYIQGEGLGWRMLAAGVTLALPFIFLSVGLQYLLSFATAGLPLLLIQFKVMILDVLLQIILTVLGISVLTAAYRIAMERQASGRTD